MACPLFNGKACRNCKDKCGGWFSTDPQLRKGCESACEASKGSSPASREAYLQSIGMDPNAVLEAQQQAQQANSNNLKIVLIVAACVVLLIIVAVIIKKILNKK